MNLTRREFAKGGLASLGFLALPGTPMFAAPRGWKPKKKPNLVFGVMSDTHMRTDYDGRDSRLGTPRRKETRHWSSTVQLARHEGEINNDDIQSMKYGKV